jgi:hypothetical protein
MAKIKVKDLAADKTANTDLVCKTASFVRELSECELGLKGGISLKKSLSNLPTLEPGNFCLTLVNGQLVEIFC